MPYVRKHQFVAYDFPAPPKTLVGFQRRFNADTAMLGKLEETHRKVLLKLRTSCTLMEAERFGELRFLRLCRALRIPKSKLRWHRLIAENAGKLLYVVRSIPNDDKALEVLATLEQERLLDLNRTRKLNQRMTVAELRELIGGPHG